MQESTLKFTMAMSTDDPEDTAVEEAVKIPILQNVAARDLAAFVF